MFEGLCCGLKDVRFIFLTDVQLVYDSTIELVEDATLAADVVDPITQFVIDRKRLVKLLSHLSVSQKLSHIT